MVSETDHSLMFVVSYELFLSQCFYLIQICLQFVLFLLSLLQNDVFADSLDDIYVLQNVVTGKVSQFLEPLQFLTQHIKEQKNTVTACAGNQPSPLLVSLEREV